MLVVVKKPGEKAERKNISDEIESLQAQVEGYIEFVYIKPLKDRGIFVIVNDEGKIHDLNPNIVMIDNKYNVVESLVGNVMFTGSRFDEEDGPCCDSLSEEQIEFLNEYVFNNTAKYSCDKGYIIDSVKIV